MAKKNASWMSDLADVIGDKRLDQIVLPGTHDSGTASLDPTLGLAPDAPPFAFQAKKALEDIQAAIERLHSLGPLADGLAKELERKLGNLSWDHLAQNVLIHGCRTQTELIGQQLESGIRYFDIRLGVREGVTRITHNMFGSPITDVFADIVSFSDGHAKEILVLDFQHFNKMTPEEIAGMAGLVLSTFGARLAPRAVGSKVTPRQLWDAGTPVIAVFSDYESVPDENRARIWNREDDLQSEWANTDSIDVLMPALTGFLKHRAPDPTSFFVTQGVLTTQTPTIGKPPALPDDALHAPVFVKRMHEFIDDLLAKLEHLKETYNIEKNAQIATPAVAKALTSPEWAAFDKNIAMIDFHEMVDYLDIVKGLNAT